MSFDNLLLERDGPGDRVALVTINRPKVLNALDSQTIDELRRAMLDLQRDDEVRAIVVTGAGEKSFVAGADINELAVQTPTGGREHALAGQHVFDVIENLGKPVIAAINGFALGGGCELAMACTLRIAADSAKMGQPEINLGLIPGYGGTQRLARLVGETQSGVQREVGREGQDGWQEGHLGLVGRLGQVDQVRTATAARAKRASERYARGRRPERIRRGGGVRNAAAALGTPGGAP